MAKPEIIPNIQKGLNLKGDFNENDKAGQFQNE